MAKSPITQVTPTPFSIMALSICCPPSPLIASNTIFCKADCLHLQRVSWHMHLLSQGGCAACRDER